MAPTPKRPPPTLSALRRNNYVAITGDSIAAGAGTRSNTRFFDLLCATGNNRAHPAFNAGIGGQVVAQVAARITDVTARTAATVTEPAWPKPGACIVEVLTNDINAVALLSTMQSQYLNGIIKPLLAAKIDPIIATVPPKGKSGASTAQKQLTSQVNAWLHSLADAYGFALIDVYAALADPADGLYLNALQIDQIHPNAAGIRAIVTANAAVFASLFPAGTVFLDRQISRTIGANMLANPQFLVDTDADGVADQWTKVQAGGTVTCSLVPDGSTGRNWQRTVFTAAPTSFTIVQNIAGGTWSVGDELDMSVRVSTSGLEGSSGGVYFRLIFTGGASTIVYLYDQFPFDVTDVLLTGRFKIPSGTTNVQVQLNGWNVGTGTVDVAEPQLLNRTVLGLL